MNKVSIFIIALLCTASVNAQNILAESFEGSFPPGGWVIKNNGSGNSWTQYTSTTNAYQGSNALEYMYNATYAANVWAFTPTLNLNTSPVTISFWVRAQSGTFPESMKLTIGSDTAIASQTTLLDSASITNTAYRKWTASYTPSSVGNYRFGFNCYSKADQYNLFVDSINVYQTLSPCTGSPLPGTITASKSSVCAGIGFVLTNSGASAASGLGYQWQSSTDGINFTDIASANSVNDSVAAILANTFYRRATTCSKSSITTYSNIIQVTLNSVSVCSVCNPANGTTLHSSSSTYIDSVIIPGTSLINSTGSTGPANGYTLFTDTTKMPTLKQNTSYSLTTSFSASAIASVWFDWDQNGKFDSSEWKQIITTGTKATISFTVPSTAKNGKTLMRVRSRATGNSNGIGDACTTFASGETEDYLINIVTPAQCTGLPVGGNVVASVNSVCSTTPVTLTDTGSTAGVAGLVYQWQSSVDGNNWTDIAAANADTYNFNGLQSNTYFRRSITCSNSTQIALSSVVLISMSPASLCVCNPANGTTLHSTSSLAIDSVYIPGTSFVNKTGTTTPTNGYALFADTTKMPALMQTQTYTLQTSYSGTAIASVWFDWDQNGTFDSSEWKQLTTSGTRATLSFTVPANATTGKTLMRIRTRSTGSSNGAKDACTTFASGETEDYLINVIKPVQCTGTPNGGTVYASANGVCSSTTVVLTDSGATTNVMGLSYQWQSSTDGNNWTNIPAATSATDTVTGLLASTYFRRTTTCTNSSLTGNSTVLLLIANPASLCVCSPSNGTTLHSATSPNIDTVSIVGTALLNITGATAPTGGYTFNTDSTKVPVLQPGSTYSLKTSFNGGTAIGSVWFDWDQNGKFDTSEWKQITTSGTNVVINFTVPANALLGKTIMRIRSRASGNPNAATDACTTFASGETEDYLIKVGTASISIQGNIVYPNAAKIPNAKIILTGTKLDSTIATGAYSFTMPVNGNYTLRASKNNDVNKANGVTTLDLALIQSHILSKNLLNSPYKIIAGDVNGDGKVTTLDLVYIKRMILGLDTVYPSKKLWVFVDSNFVFTIPSSPFPYKDSISLINVADNKTKQTFIGIKLGDVNWDWNPLVAKPGSTSATKIQGELKLETDDKIIIE